MPEWPVHANLLLKTFVTHWQHTWINRKYSTMNSHVLNFCIFFLSHKIGCVPSSRYILWIGGKIWAMEHHILRARIKSMIKKNNRSSAFLLAPCDENPSMTFGFSSQTASGVFRVLGSPWARCRSRSINSYSPPISSKEPTVTEWRHEMPTPLFHKLVHRAL